MMTKKTKKEEGKGRVRSNGKGRNVVILGIHDGVRVVMDDNSKLYVPPVDICRYLEVGRGYQSQKVNKYFSRQKSRFLLSNAHNKLETTVLPVSAALRFTRIILDKPQTRGLIEYLEAVLAAEKVHPVL
jgi:hypothetical protein